MLPKRLKNTTDTMKTAVVKATGPLTPTGKSPDEMLGELFTEVQKQQVYDDGKTFVDLVPRKRVKQIQEEYRLERQDPDFDLRDFVSRHFYAFDDTKAPVYITDTTRSRREHITDLWSVLERRNRVDRGSLIALPHAYIVPGGRFSEQFYWDSYFIMLGLAADKKWDIIEGMLKNYAYMIRKFGFIPTANRTYFLSRSQPPMFTQMVKLFAQYKGRRVLVEYLPYLLLEYRFWMKGKSKLAKAEHKAYARVAELPNGIVLNRYYDNKTTPRPESLREDVTTAETAEGRDASRLYLHLRAAAESGWDFSSRWFTDPHDIRTVHTTDIIPVDLNSLLYELEVTIAEAYQLMRNPLSAKKYRILAERRARAINEYCWSETEGFFVDYNFHHRAPTGRLSLAAVFPLYAKIATKEQAQQVANRLEKEFLREGGLVSTLVDNGQQWDAPNGWAPLHWMAIEGLRNYEHYRLSGEIKRRWIAVNAHVYKQQGKMIEKYNVVDIEQLGGGGEYPLQDGFGWTNGVLAALLDEDVR